MIQLLGQAGANAARLDTACVNGAQTVAQQGLLNLAQTKAKSHAEGGWQALLWGDLRWQDKPQMEPLPELIRRFRAQGSAALDKALGHFRLLVSDAESRQLWLAIDRTGTQSLYYSQIDGDLSFASHLRPMIKALPRTARINPQAIYNYLYFHMIPSPDTVYQDCYKLEPGHVLHWQDGKLSKQNYYMPAFRQNGQKTAETAKRRLLPILEAAVSRQAINGHTGAFLSGGLDSSTVAGVLAKVSPKAPPTFNIAFDQERYDESPWARLSAAHFHTRHHEYRLQPDEALAMLPTIAQYGDEPFGNSSALPTYFCAKVARDQGIPLLLAGDGGDELFAGNTRYAKQKLFEPYARMPGGIKSVTESLLNIDSDARWPGPFGKLQSYIRQANVPLPDRLQSYNFLHLNSPEKVFSRELLSAVDQEYPLHIWRQRYHEAKADHPVDAMLYLDWKFTLADNDLVKVRGMCELAGIDVAFPMLDDELIQLSLQVTANDKLPGQNLRAFYKDAVKGFLPDATLNKSKHGFGLPFGMWLKEHAGLRELVHAKLSALQQREWLSPAFVQDAMRQHEQGHASFYGELVWLMLVLELWLEAHG